MITLADIARAYASTALESLRVEHIMDAAKGGRRSYRPSFLRAGDAEAFIASAKAAGFAVERGPDYLDDDPEFGDEALMWADLTVRW